MAVNKLTSPISQNDLINKTNEIIDNLGGGANTDLSNLTAIGEAHFQEPLVSGTNIKTINNNSILGSGNIDTKETFIAEHGVTTYQEVLNAYNAEKEIFTTYVDTEYQATNILRLAAYNAAGGYFHFVSFSYNGAGYFHTYLYQSSGWNTIGIWTSERTENKVTSISSSSTNAQYPSAKLLYDQLALKQNTSTAVTHTANTAVGNSTTPVYINSSGVATSTGFSIGSGRFDGQWIKKSSELATSTAAALYRIVLSSYISNPHDTDYEVLFHYHAFKSGAGNGTIYTNIVGDVADIYSSGWQGIYVTANSRQADGWFIMPVSPPSYYVFVNIKSAFTEFGLTALAYRRIGTNT